MNTILASKYTAEKQVFTKLLIESKMIEITYSETFILKFIKYINTLGEDNYNWEVRKMNLIIDAPFWVGEKSKWEEYMKDSNEIIALDDNVLAYELVNIRYNNLIQVHNVEFFEKYLCILLDGERVLLISYSSDSDYPWILEECNDKNEYEKMAVFCQGNEIIVKNISEII